MKFIQGKAREQLVFFPSFLDQIIEQENEVRLIDIFVDSLDMERLKIIRFLSFSGSHAISIISAKLSVFQN